MKNNFRCPICGVLKEQGKFVGLKFQKEDIPFKVCLPCICDYPEEMLDGIYYNPELNEIILIEYNNSLHHFELNVGGKFKESFYDSKALKLKAKFPRLIKLGSF